MLEVTKEKATTQWTLIYFSSLFQKYLGGIGPNKISTDYVCSSMIDS